MALEASAYDEIASMYHALWFDWYLPAAGAALERVFFERVAAGTQVLDVCCGSGHVTRELVRRGYRVTGVDNSAELVALARREVMGAEFVVADVRELGTLEMAEQFGAAISTFDSLNHILTLAGLERTMAGVRGCLEAGGRFVFDMNLEEAYGLDLKQWSVDIHDNSVGMVRGEYDRATGRARTELLWFARAAGEPECWRRRHSVVEQQCYRLEEILGAMGRAGFREVEWGMAVDLGVTAELGYGRVFVWGVG